MRISRRRFLQLAGATAAAAPFARLAPAEAITPEVLGQAAAGTTLGQTIVKGALLGTGTNGSYYRLAAGPGEPHLVRQELGTHDPSAPVHCSLAFVHFTDIHLVDTQSPLRVEFLDQFADSPCDPADLFNAAFRPQETMSLPVLEHMIRAVRGVRRGPKTGRRFRFAMSTGDNVDNQQHNETRWFIDLMDGGKTVTPNSGGPAYEGVQSPTWTFPLMQPDTQFWHPDPVADRYKLQYGFPDYPGLLSEVIAPLTGTGIRMPWYQTFGNHDGLIQGNFPKNLAMDLIAEGGLKVTGPPPGFDPCTDFGGLLANPVSLFAGPARPVTADANRRVILRNEYVQEHFDTTGFPAGHGFTQQNLNDGTAYYVVDRFRPFRLISLDTMNPGGESHGSIGQAQFDWLEQRLIEVHSAYFDAGGGQVTTANPDRMVVIFSHHGLRSLTTQFIEPDPFNPSQNDQPRVLAPEIEALVHRFPNVIAWVNGHTHQNIVEPRPDPLGQTSGFWDIGTAAHCDWNCQVRTVEVAHRNDGTLSIFCTMVDHDSPIDPTGATGTARLASIHRELAANDYQKGFDSSGPGGPEDRNVELVLPAPAWVNALGLH